MEILRALLPIVGIVIVVIFGLGLVAVLRTQYLSRVTVSAQKMRDVQIELTEAARRASIQPGIEIDLMPFWSATGLDEPDRQAILEPLFESQVFGWMDGRSPSEVQNFVNWVGKTVWKPERRKIVVSQWVREDISHGRTPTLVIERVLGDVVTGPKVGGDYVGGDTVGGDKVGRDRTGGDHTDGDKIGRDSRSGNTNSIAGDVTATYSSAELAAVLADIADQAQRMGEANKVVDALEWAVGAVEQGENDVDFREATRAARALDGASMWVRTAIGALVEGATGAVAEHWLLEILGGV